MVEIEGTDGDGRFGEDCETGLIGGMAGMTDDGVGGMAGMTEDGVGGMAGMTEDGVCGMAGMTEDGVGGRVGCDDEGDFLILGMTGLDDLDWLAGLAEGNREGEIESTTGHSSIVLALSNS